MTEHNAAQSNGAALTGGSLASPGVPIRKPYPSQQRTALSEEAPELDRKPRALALERLSVAVESNVGNEESQALELERQAESLGWEIIEHHGRRGESADVDKDIWSGYLRAWEMVQAGEVDAIMAVDSTRFSKSTTDVGLFFAHCVKYNVRRVCFSGRVLDPYNETDKLTATVLGAVAEMENAIKKRRALRKAAQNAREGKPQNGKRPYGYKPDKITLERKEADIIRELMRRALAGAPLSTLARELNEKGIPTAAGKTWSPAMIRAILWSWRIAGIRSHKDIPVKADAWAAIVSKSDVEAFRIMCGTGTKRIGRPPALLTGLVYCKCHGYRMNNHTTKFSDEYRANGGTKNPRCIVGTPKAELEAYVALAFFRRIADGKWRDETQASNALRLAELEGELATLRADRLADAASRGAGKLSLEALEAAEAPRMIREAALVAESQTLALAPTQSGLEEAEESWESLSRDERRTLLDALIERIEYKPRNYREPFDGKRHCAIKWRRIG